jgi:hypothetical protein
MPLAYHIQSKCITDSREVAILFTGWCTAYVLLVSRRNQRSLISGVAVPTILGLLAWAAWGLEVVAGGIQGYNELLGELDGGR